MNWPASLVDEVGSWPDHVRDLIAVVAEPLADSTDYVQDLHVPDDDVAAIHAALVGTRWRLYHCTRLLDHERDNILTNGLAPATEVLLDDKLTQAVEHGHLSPGDAEVLRESHMLRPGGGQRQGRQGRICALTTRASFADYHGLWRLFEHWGGELIYFDQPDPMLERLRSLGTPSIVVVDLTLITPPSRGWYPPIERLLVGAHLGMDQVHGETNQPVNGFWPVNAVWQPNAADSAAWRWVNLLALDITSKPPGTIEWE